MISLLERTVDKKNNLEWAVTLLKKSSITSVIGDWGMGKSTFSNKLSIITLQNVFHLEEEQFYSAGKPRPLNQFLRRYYETLNNGNCIFDGNSFRKESIFEDKYNCDFILERLHISDAIVYFDGEPEKVKANYYKRAFRVEAGEEKRVGGSWNSTKEMDVAINWYYERKELFAPKLIIYQNKIIVIKNHEHADIIINAMSSSNDCLLEKISLTS